MKDKTYILHPSYLGLELGLAVDVDDFKFLNEDRETEEGHLNGARGLWSVDGDMTHLFEPSCDCF